jgi:murein DD-endopeptidase MepM/ murein hydrolase activator NlpD
VGDKRDELAAYAVSAFQSADTDMLDLGWSLAADSAGEALDDLQIQDSIGDKQSVVLQELQANEVLLELTEQRVEEAKKEVAVQRQEAADHLAETRVLRARAETARDNVASRLQDLRKERLQIAKLKQQELQRLNALQADRERIEDRLREIAERRARQHRLSLLTASPPDAGGALAWPIANTYVTSSYGMRLHPILNVWKLHDGTDFGAACGTPLYAPAAGVVQSAYYNAGYGNRIIIGHGIVRGVSLWTSVNHLTSFAVRAGEHVSRGELIGYSGTTGYSTGCHLHFMVYVNGYTVDPMRWL